MRKSSLRWALVALAAASSATIHARTLSVGIEIDRDSFRIVAYTLKDRPYVPSVREAKEAQIEVALLGSGAVRHTQRLDVGLLCLLHGPDAAPHVEGDTIRVHRDTFIVELPDVEGFDRVEVTSSGRSLGIEPLTAQRFVAAGGRFSYSDLAIADASEPEQPDAALLGGGGRWPAEYGDPDIYTLYGSLAEVGRRINVVIVPDGYTYAEKSVMQSHAASLVNFLRNKSPYKEHDPFFNYTLVYAYSNESGTDQCDCSILANTAFGTRFPDAGYPCLDGGNRCLYYGGHGQGGCDTRPVTNIALAEIRAPAKDTTIIMVNTSRYGGCAGTRGVYSAGSFGALDVGVHELGHTFAGLADEYEGPGCGIGAGEINTSGNGVSGSWPEWIAELGAPWVGAQYYESCLYRPEFDCEMRSLGPEFCRVCKQHMSLRIFGHPRVISTAPIDVATPESAIYVDLDLPIDFSVSTRLPSGPGVTNAITWRFQGPNDPSPVTVASGVQAYQRTFLEEGSYTVECDVIADMNFIKPARYDTNRDIATWYVKAAVYPPPGEVSAPGSETLLTFASRDSLVWQEAAVALSSRFNVYRGTVSGLAAGDYGACLQQRLLTNGTQDTQVPPPSTCWTYLVTGTTSGGEGPMGNNRAGTPRENKSPCQP